eukprot:2820286-Pyramimonas_sp.AAC.1
MPPPSEDRQPLPPGPLPKAMPATRPDTGSHSASDEDADMATGLEATPADNVPTFVQQSETM